MMVLLTKAFTRETVQSSRSPLDDLWKTAHQEPIAIQMKKKSGDGSVSPERSASRMSLDKQSSEVYKEKEEVILHKTGDVVSWMNWKPLGKTGKLPREENERYFGASRSMKDGNDERRRRDRRKKRFDVCMGVSNRYSTLTLWCHQSQTSYFSTFLPLVNTNRPLKQW